MENFLALRREFPNRLLACVDTLGEAKKLTIIDRFCLDLETERGHWTISRFACEPPLGCCGFVGVKLPLGNAGMALYLDVRISAALIKAGIWSVRPDAGYEFVTGKDVPLFSEDESLDILRSELPYDAWALEVATLLTTWTDINGKPIPHQGDYIAGMGTDSNIGALDARLWLLWMLAKPSDMERNAGKGNPYAYLARRMERFLAARYSHNKNLAQCLSSGQ